MYPVADVICVDVGELNNSEALLRRRECIFEAGMVEGVSENLRIRSSAKPHPLANRFVRGVMLNGEKNLGRVGM
jgi:hypothetical protein